MEIKNSVAVITGAASGIGRAIAMNLARHGASVMLADVAAEGLEAAVNAIQAAGGKAKGQVTDVTDESSVSALMEAAVKNFGQINIVVPSAGIFRDALFLSTDRETGKVYRKMTTDQFRAVMEVNLVGTFLTLREAAERMVNNGWEGVLFTISSINKQGELGQLNYASTKSAVALWPKILAGEFHARKIKNIRVVGIAPGYVDTPILQGMKPEALEAVVKNVPIGRLIQAEEMTGLVEYVIQNGAIHGTTLEISGGVISRGLAK